MGHSFLFKQFPPFKGETVAHSIQFKQVETRQQCRLWPIPYGSSTLNRTVTMQIVTYSIRPSRLNHMTTMQTGLFHMAQAVWTTWQQCRLWPIPYGPSRLNHMATMQTVAHSIWPKQAESHGNNADCGPFYTAQAGWITWPPCRPWPIPYNSSSLNHMATMLLSKWMYKVHRLIYDPQYLCHYSDLTGPQLLDRVSNPISSGIIPFSIISKSSEVHAYSYVRSIVDPSLGDKDTGPRNGPFTSAYCQRQGGVWLDRHYTRLYDRKTILLVHVCNGCIKLCKIQTRFTWNPFRYSAYLANNITNGNPRA